MAIEDIDHTAGDAGSLATAAQKVLLTADARAKAAASIAAGQAWQRGDFARIGHFALTGRPARPAAPPLVPPRGVAKRKINAGSKGRIALLHALAHIELNAIDLAWDLVARFGAEMGAEFCRDWVAVGSDEGRHFLMLDDHLRSFDCAYGDFPAHDGLWQAAADTSDDLLARLAIVPMVLEARGLDVTPATVGRLRAVGDDASADILMAIYTDELPHAPMPWQSKAPCLALRQRAPLDSYFPCRRRQSLVPALLRGPRFGADRNLACIGCPALQWHAEAAVQ